MTPQMFIAKLTKARPGEKIEYHRGAYARSFEAGSLAWDYYTRGIVDLVQERHGEGDYSFYAIKRRVVSPPVIHTMLTAQASKGVRKRRER